LTTWLKSYCTIRNFQRSVDNLGNPQTKTPHNRNGTISSFWNLYIYLKKQFQVFYFFLKWFLKKFFWLPRLPAECWKLHIMQQLFNHIVKSYENCWALKLVLGHMFFEISKEKKSIRSELPKIAMLPKTDVCSFRD